MDRLKVIRASAGSGKTFTLAVEYIKYLVLNPMSYKNILAVTFTNKATLEMKQRVLSQLYGLSRGLDDSDDYMAVLKTALKDEKLDTKGQTLEDFIRRRCRMALDEIIHNYHRFRIETIDSFFQSIVRELAHDLDLTANLRVDLDNTAALKEGVGKVIDSIVSNKDTSDRVFNFVRSKMDDNKNWNVSDEMQKFGENIFNEHFLEHGEELRKKLEDPHFIKSIDKKIKTLRNEKCDEVVNIASEMLNRISRHGYGMDDFTNKGTGIYAYLEKYPKSKQLKVSNKYLEFTPRYLGCLEGAEKWSKNEDIQAMIDDEGLIEMLESLHDKLYNNLPIVKTCEAVIRNLNNLSLINTISKMVQQATSERNDFLLANTNHFLSQMIEGSDVPFIYERTGSRFNHIMIDEFQDTSGLQWKNFKPLIKNSLDSGDDCLLVGDVKQSIYRWRGGEWSILNNIDSDIDFSGHVENSPLKTNYRSMSNVVKFNNGFFENASNEFETDYISVYESSSDDISTAYNECDQEVPSKRKDGEGYVRIELMNPVNSGEESQVEESEINDVESVDAGPSTSIELSSTEKWHCERLAENVQELLSKGVKTNDICILIRKKKHVKIICDYFDHNVFDSEGNPIKIVSSEAYELGNSTVLCLIIYALKVLSSPTDHLSHSMLTYHYQTDVVGSDRFIKSPNEVFLSPSDEQDKYLPSEFTDHIHELEIVPLHELCERLYSIFGLDRLKGQDSYIFAFFDYLDDFLDTYTADIDSFLDYWDETMSHKMINAESDDGIRIMTIHKSKGLEFHTVLMPFCSWLLIGPTNYIWCEGDGKSAPFNELPLVPISRSGDLIDSEYGNEMKEEFLKIYVDNLNLMYVAFTRASRNLIVISDSDGSNTVKAINKFREKKKDMTDDDIIEMVISGNNDLFGYEKKKLTTMYDVLVRCLPTTLSVVQDETDNLIYTFSDSYIMPSVAETESKKDNEEKEGKKNVFSYDAERMYVDFHSGRSRAEFRQSNNSERFVNGEDIDGLSNSYLNEGLLFHEILSYVRTEADIDKAISRLDFDGNFADAFQRENVKRLVKKAFQNPKSKDWFDPRWTVINEHGLIFKDDKGKVCVKRPDRVITDGKETIVIDYKTGHYDEEHEKQVGEYMELLKDMGMKNVRGYLWYIRKGDVIQVDS